MLCLFRTRQMCLMWVIPMRDLLPLLKRHPQLYHKACSQVVPKVLMDYLTISPLEVSISQTRTAKCSRYFDRLHTSHVAQLLAPHLQQSIDGA